jgi:hypothetical protein
MNYNKILQINLNIFMIDLLIIYKIIIILIKNRYVNILKTLNFKMFIMDFNN